MALTAKERQSRRREKVRMNPELREEVKRRDRERKKLKKEQWTVREKENRRVAHRVQMQNYRKKHQSLQPIDLTEHLPFTSRQTFGKALKRSRTVLPKSPRKRRRVVEALAQDVGLAVGERKKKGSTALSPETAKMITDFYLSNEISWQAPGRKDQVIVRSKTDGGQVKKSIYQARYMLMSLKEAFSQFTEHRTCSLANFVSYDPLSSNCLIIFRTMYMFVHITKTSGFY
jgi:hypothetical protein